MKSKLTKYYLFQAFRNLKQSMFLVICVALCVSFIAGTSYASNTIDNYKLQTQNMPFIDFTIRFPQYSGNISNDFHLKDSEVYSVVNNNTFQQNVHRYILLSFQSGIYAEKTTYLRSPSICLFDGGFYSEIFNEKLKILSGRAPNTSEEVMISSTYFEIFNISLNTNWNLFLHFGSYTFSNSEGSISLSLENFGTYFNQSIANVTVVGVYENNFGYNRKYNERNNQVALDNPIFGFFDGTKNDTDNPIITGIKSLEINQNIISINYGYAGFIQAQYNVQNFGKIKESIDGMVKTYSEQLDTMMVLSRLSESLGYVQDQLNYNQLSMLFINIPIFIFSLFIIRFLISIDIKKRFPEFYLNKIRGMPFSIQRNQIFVQNILIALLSSVLGVFFGIFISKVIVVSILPILGIIASVDSIMSYFVIIPNTALITGAISVFLVLLSSRKPINDLKELEIYQLIKSIGEGAIPNVYDERSLFGIKKEEWEWMKTVDPELGDWEQEKELYRDIVELAEKNKKTPTVKYFIIGSIPLIVFIISVLRKQNVSIPFPIAFLFDNFWMLKPLFVLMPIFLTLGLLRYFFIDKPSRFAKIFHSISQKMKRSKVSSLFSVQMVNNHYLSKIILLIGIIFSTLIALNGMCYTTFGNQMVYENISIATDINVEGEFANEMIGNVTLLDQIETQMNSVLKQFSIEESAHFVWSFQVDKNVHHSMMFVDLKEYQKMFADQLKFQKYDAIKATLDSYINKKSNESDCLYAIKINQYGFQYAPYQMKNLSLISGFPNINVQVDDFVPYFPGFYQDSSLDFLIFDMADLAKMGINPKSIVAPYYKLFVNLDSASSIRSANLTELKNQLEVILKPYFRSYSIQFYDYSEFENDSIFSLKYGGVYNLLYLSIIMVTMILSFMLGIMISFDYSLQKDLFSVLRARGMNQRDILAHFLSQFIFVFISASIIGILTGLLTFGLYQYSIPNFEIISQIIIVANLPRVITINWLEFLLITGLSLIILLLTFITINILEKRKKISSIMPRSS